MPQLPDPNPLKSREIPQDTLDSQRILTCFPFAIIFFSGEVGLKITDPQRSGMGLENPVYCVVVW
jgi:hypothetical protein